MNKRFTEHGCDWSRLSERERGFCLGYHEAKRRDGTVLKDVEFTHMTPEYREDIATIARGILAP